METKRCPRCGEVKPVSDFYFNKSGRKAGRPYSRCKKCNKEIASNWAITHPRYSTELAHLRGTKRPMEEAKDCSAWLGVHIAEQILSEFFNNIERMPYGHPGYDFVCGKGYKIDCKSACLLVDPIGHTRWYFNIRKNQTPDYFLLLGFNEDRENLMPLHIWLVPGHLINSKVCISVTNYGKGLARFAKYERPLDKVVMCCDKMKASV